MPATPEIMANIETYGVSNPVNKPMVDTCGGNDVLTQVIKSKKHADTTNNKISYLVQKAGAGPTSDFCKLVTMAILAGDLHVEGVSGTNVISVPYAIPSALGSGLGTDTTELAENSQLSKNLSTLGKGYPQRGDFVGIICTQGSASASDAENYFETFVKIPNVLSNGTGPVLYDLYVGICNTTQTDFVTPFDTSAIGYQQRVIIAPQELAKYLSYA